MEKRALGSTGLKIAPLILGGNVFGWTADRDMSFRLLDAFVAAGLDGIDTADVYTTFAGTAPGASESIIGEWLARGGRRDRVTLMTKVGLLQERPGLSAANITAAVEDSLRRMRTDYIDIYFAHRDDDKVPLDETLAAFERLVRAGKVRATGASNYSATRLRAAFQVGRDKKLHSYDVLQPRYNLYDRKEFETDLAPIIQAEGLGVTPFFGLAAGFLTGKYRTLADTEGRARKARVAEYFTPRGERILKALDVVAARHNTKPAQIALAWVMARPHVTASIASATNTDQLDELLGALRVKLSDADRATLEEASREG